MMQWLVFFLFAVFPPAFARRGGRTFSQISQDAEAHLKSGDTQTTGARAMVSNQISRLIDSWESKSDASLPNINAIIDSATKNVKLDEAVKRVEQHLPAEVASLVRLTSSNEVYQSKKLEKEAITRARNVFNNMVFEAEAELTLVVFECKEFHERNRLTYEQVTNDIARLGSQLGALNSKKMTSNQCIETQEVQYKKVKGQMEDAQQAYRKKRDADDIEMTRRRNDLAVFEFVLEVTKCKDEKTLFAQTASNNSKAQFCSTGDGDIQINFQDPKLQAKVEKMMTPEARLALRTALGQVTGHLGLLQESKETTTTTVAKYQAVAKRGSDPVAEGPGSGNARKCADMPPDPERCGKVHDTLSIDWGRFRDEVDELADEMEKDLDDWERARANFNEQLQAITDMSGKCQGELAEATSNIDADLAEQQEKEKQARELEHVYRKTCAAFKKKITTILYEKICEIITVRNAVIDHDNSEAKPSDVTDCELADWVPLNGKCITSAGSVITCDDTCPREDPNLCGGFETMSREIIIAPNQYGIKCGQMRKEKRCGQKKCPVDCAMSQWSGYSACSKECEGGIQIKTRYVITKPKNGGMGCDTVQEPRACNTGSCDRDCSLSHWSDFSFCSQACDGGFKYKTKHVTRPIRGNGKCPTDSSEARYHEQTCNTQQCTGDEICIAQQDLIIAMDASGSLKNAGFLAIRNFTYNLTKRYEAKFYGVDAIKMGAVTFGNGKLVPQDDGTMLISPAKTVHALTDKLADVREKINAETWQKGFTNMAQALLQAKNLLGRGGRPYAQSAVLVISDGKPSFKYQTAQAAQELKDQNIKIFMAPIVEFDNDELTWLKAWASKPTDSNYERIPGFSVLGGENDALYIQRLIVKFCPDATSPLMLKQEAEISQYYMIREDGFPNGDCAAFHFEARGTIDDCVAAARARGNMGFVFGKQMAAGICFSTTIKIDQAYYDKYEMDHENPPCPAASGSGDAGFASNPFYDTYVINPQTFKASDEKKK